MKATALTGGAQSIRRAIAVLRVLASAQERGTGASEIARELGLNRSTVHRMLSVLVEERLAERHAGARVYTIGPEASLLGLARKTPFPLRARVEPFLRVLSSRTGDSSFLTIRSGLDSVCVARATGTHPIQVLSVEVGARRPLGLGVGGLVLLASLERDERLQLVLANERRLAAHGLSRRSLVERIGAVAANGYAYAPAGLAPATSALAVPVRDARGATVAAISVAAIASRLRPGRVREVVTLMREQAALFSRSLRDIRLAP